MQHCAMRGGMNLKQSLRTVLHRANGTIEMDSRSNPSPSASVVSRIIVRWPISQAALISGVVVPPVGSTCQLASAPHPSITPESVKFRHISVQYACTYLFGTL
jgi:hypothetical protein